MGSIFEVVSVNLTSDGAFLCVDIFPGTRELSLTLRIVPKSYNGLMSKAAALVLVLLCAGCDGSNNAPPTAVTYGPDCIDHVRGLTGALMIYLSDSDDTFPLADWTEGLAPYVRYQTTYTDPALPLGTFGYALNPKIIGQNATTFARSGLAYTFFDTTIKGKDALSDLTSLPNPARHNGLDSVAFIDGRAVQDTPPNLIAKYSQYASGKKSPSPSLGVPGK